MEQQYMHFSPKQNDLIPFVVGTRPADIG